MRKQREKGKKYCAKLDISNLLRICSNLSLFRPDLTTWKIKILCFVFFWFYVQKKLWFRLKTFFLYFFFVFQSTILFEQYSFSIIIVCVCNGCTQIFKFFFLKCSRNSMNFITFDLLDAIIMSVIFLRNYIARYSHLKF